MAKSVSQIDPGLLRRARENARLSQSEVARRLGVSFSTVNRWESGKQRIGSERLVAVLALYGVPMESVVRGRGTRGDLSFTETKVAKPALGWPDGWRARAYRLGLEAEEAGAPEELLGQIHDLMLAPELQVRWSAPQPPDVLAAALDTIEAAARALLRAQGYAVRTDRGDE